MMLSPGFVPAGIALAGQRPPRPTAANRPWIFGTSG